MPRISKEEAHEQKIVVRFLEELKKTHPNIHYTSTNMGSYMNVGQVLVAKAMGYTTGTADLLILMPGTFGAILCIEQKKPNGKQRPEQKVWQELCQRNNIGYVVCYSAPEAIETIRKHLKI